MPRGKGAHRESFADTQVGCEEEGDVGDRLCRSVRVENKVPVSQARVSDLRGGACIQRQTSVPMADYSARAGGWEAGAGRGVATFVRRKSLKRTTMPRFTGPKSEQKLWYRL